MATLKKRAIPTILFILAIILALSPFHLFPVCTHLMKNGKHMSCYYSAWFLIGMAVLMAIFSLIALFLSRHLWISVSYAAILILAILGYVVPNRMIAIGHMKIQGWQIGLCMAPDMACRTTTLPAVTVILVLMGVLSIVGLILNFLTEKK